MAFKTSISAAPNNIISLNDKISLRPEDDDLGVNYNQNIVGKAQNDMDKNDNYVTKEVLDLKLENISTKIDSKFDQMDSKIDSKFELLNNKFDQIPTMIELALSKQNEEQRKQKNELIKWFIGTFIAAVAVVIAYLSMN